MVLTADIYRKPAPRVIPPFDPATATGPVLFIFTQGNKIANWRTRAEYGDASKGSVTVGGYGFALVSSSTLKAEGFRRKHGRALRDTTLTQTSVADLIARGCHTVYLDGREIRTSAIEQHLAQRPEYGVAS
ncbi:MAG TPA: hypothetical protein VN519_06470 [Bryobacteraceae bacterium]|nr:hypothetical protein [Bryobacteraceae bacterium]